MKCASISYCTIPTPQTTVDKCGSKITVKILPINMYTTMRYNKTNVLYVVEYFANNI